MELQDTQEEKWDSKLPYLIVAMPGQRSFPKLPEWDNPDTFIRHYREEQKKLKATKIMLEKMLQERLSMG